MLKRYCNRCGKEVSAYGEKYIRIEPMVFVGEFEQFIDSGVDLCSDCYEKFSEFLNTQSKNKEESDV